MTPMTYEPIPNVPMRYLLVHLRFRDTPDTIRRYLPDNYRVVHECADGCTVVVEGRDAYGWTLDGYVRPRLLSGLIASEEIDLSHPVMKEVPL